MSYEQHCIEFALYSNQEEEHWQYEEAAAYDRWDGHRMDCEGLADDEYYELTPEDAWTAVLWEEEQAEEQLAIKWANAFDPLPF